jgi:hypothetical protein
MRPGELHVAAQGQPGLKNRSLMIVSASPRRLVDFAKPD